MAEQNTTVQIYGRSELMAKLAISDDGTAKVGSSFRNFYKNVQGLKGKQLTEAVNQSLKSNEAQAFFAAQYNQCIREGWTPDYAEAKPGKKSGTSDKRTFTFSRPKEHGSIDFSGQERLKKMFGENSQVYRDIVAAGLFKKPVVREVVSEPQAPQAPQLTNGAETPAPAAS